MVQKFELGNGVTVLVDEMRDVRSFALGIFVRAGSGEEAAARRGISHFLEHVLFKRTNRRSTVGIAREIDRLGGDVDAFTTKEYTGFYAHSLDANFAAALDLLADLVLSPAFVGEDVEVERGVILEEIGEANDNPDDLVHELFVRAFWKTHPLSEPILGTVETVRSIGVTDLHRYHRDRYRPGNLIFSVAGHVLAARVAEAIEKLFRRRPSRGRRRGSGPGAPRPHQHVEVRSRKGLEQVHVCFGMAGPSQASERRYAASLLDIVLGGGMSSRLFQEVREKRGLAYSVASSLNSYRLGGYETITAACAPKNLSRVLDVTLRELRRLKRDGVRPKELGWAKENLKGNLILSLESTVSRMSLQARQEFYYGHVLPAEEMLARVDGVTPEDVSAEAERLLDPRVLSLTIVGNIGKSPLSAPELAQAL